MGAGPTLFKPVGSPAGPDVTPTAPGRAVSVRSRGRRRAGRPTVVLTPKKLPPTTLPRTRAREADGGRPLTRSAQRETRRHPEELRRCAPRTWRVEASSNFPAPDTTTGQLARLRVMKWGRSGPTSLQPRGSTRGRRHYAAETTVCNSATRMGAGARRAPVG
jgi:hypothetical protein